LSDQGGQEPEDYLLERLNEAATGDAAVRQLRRRYDLLRADYERLLDRLGELEDRLNEAAAQPRPAPPLSEAIAQALAEPLMRLRDDYLSAVTGIQAVVTGLEGLATGFKGQHVSTPPPPAAAAPKPPGEAPPEPSVDEPDIPAGPPVHKMHIDVKGSGFGELLDFQERLSQIPGVSRVSISAIDNERATLVVELDRPGAS
jgi:hypothetical protein